MYLLVGQAFQLPWGKLEQTELLVDPSIKCQNDEIRIKWKTFIFFPGFYSTASKRKTKFISNLLLYPIICLQIFFFLNSKHHQKDRCTNICLWKQFLKLRKRLCILSLDKNEYWVSTCRLGCSIRIFSAPSPRIS